MNYVIVIAWGQGFMAVNEPSPRAKPEDKVCLHCHKSLATRYISHPDWSEFCILGDTKFKFSIATIATVLFFHSTVVVATEMAACSYDPYCLGLCEWTDCPGALQLEDTPRPTYPLVSAPPPHSPPATASSSSHSSLSVQPESTRFKFATKEDLSTFAKGLVPENTTRSTKSVGLEHLQCLDKGKKCEVSCQSSPR